MDNKQARLFQEGVETEKRMQVRGMVRRLFSSKREWRPRRGCR
jgi:hypothetical protein